MTMTKSKHVDRLGLLVDMEKNRNYALSKALLGA